MKSLCSITGEITDFNTVLVSRAELEQTKKERDGPLAACVELVRKVEAGKARSTKSYEQMKAAIAFATAPAVTTPDEDCPTGYLTGLVRNVIKRNMHEHTT